VAVLRSRPILCAALVAALIALSAAAVRAAPGPPGTETYGRQFCQPAPLAAADRGPEVGIAVERASVAAGGTAFARVENRSAKQVEFGLEFHVQRFAGGHWRRAPGAPHGPWIQIALMLPAGQSGSCMRYRVPADAPPGRYRFSRELIAGPGPARPYLAPFRVTG
jgi:Big-like domain-containing protein